MSRSSKRIRHTNTHLDSFDFDPDGLHGSCYLLCVFVTMSAIGAAFFSQDPTHYMALTIHGLMVQWLLASIISARLTIMVSRRKKSQGTCYSWIPFACVLIGFALSASLSAVQVLFGLYERSPSLTAAGPFGQGTHALPLNASRPRAI